MAAVYLDGRLLDSRVQWLCINSELDVSVTLISLVDNPVSDAGNLPAAVKAHKNAQRVSSPTVVSQRLPAPAVTCLSVRVCEELCQGQSGGSTCQDDPFSAYLSLIAGSEQ